MYFKLKKSGIIIIFIIKNLIYLYFVLIYDLPYRVCVPSIYIVYIPLHLYIHVPVY